MVVGWLVILPHSMNVSSLIPCWQLHVPSMLFLQVLPWREGSYLLRWLTGSCLSVQTSDPETKSSFSHDQGLSKQETLKCTFSITPIPTDIPAWSHLSLSWHSLLPTMPAPRVHLLVSCCLLLCPVPSKRRPVNPGCWHTLWPRPRNLHTYSTRFVFLKDTNTFSFSIRPRFSCAFFTCPDRD